MNKNNEKLLVAILLVLYLAVIVRLFVFKFAIHLPSGVTLKLGGYGDYGYNLVPFKTISMYVGGHLGLIEIGNLLGNIILFMPLGFLTPFIYRSISWKSVLCVAVLFSLCIEILQLVLHAGTVDIDDIILNTLGGVLGYLVFLLFVKWKLKKK